MADNKLDVKVNVTVNGEAALAELAEIKSTASSTGSGVSKDFSNISKSADSAGNGLKSAFTKGLSGVSEKVRGISESFSGLNGVMSTVMGTIGLGSFKSLTLDMAMTRDQAKNLLAVTMQGNSTFAEASQTAGAFIDKIKEGTSGSVVKLQMMIEAMNGIKLSTGMANSDLESLNDVIRKVGEASLLMGDDTEHATFVMKEAMAGLNGDFTVLKDQFGITKEKMLDAGWSGAADDVQGYRQALEQCLSGLGDMGQVMDTTSGKISKIKSNFSSAGLEIGNQMLPAVDWVASAFLEANENGNILAKGILYAGGAASMFASLAPTLKPMFETWDQMKGVVDKARSAIDFLTDAEKIQETVTTALDGITAKLTGTKATEAAATEAEAAASTEAALAKDAETFSNEANTLATDADALSTDADTIAKEANTIASGEAAAGNVTLAGALSASASSAWALTTALLANPLTWIVVAVVALVAVMWYLYDTNEEVRNSVNELGSMLSGALSGAFDTVSGAVTAFVNALVPAALALVDFLKWVVLFYTDAPRAQEQFNAFITNGVQFLTDSINNALTSIVTGIQEKFNQAIALGGMLVALFVQSIVTRWNNLVARVGLIFSLVLQVIRTRLNQARAVAGTLATLIRTVIVQRIQSLVTRVRTFFQQIVNNIRSRMANAASTARQKAQEILEGIRSKVQQIPQIVADEFNKIKDRIKTALDNAKQVAFSAITDLVNTVKSALGIASPGFIQRMFTYEFTSIPGIIMQEGIRAVHNAGDMAHNIVKTWTDSFGDGLSVPFEETEANNVPVQSRELNTIMSIIPQFNAFDQSNIDMGSILSLSEKQETPNKQNLSQNTSTNLDFTTIGASMPQTTTTTNQSKVTNNNVSQDDHTIIYNIDHVTVDVSRADEDENERWFNMLNKIVPGGV